MPDEPFQISTPRLTLRPWCDSDRSVFARLHADPAVMADLGGPIDRRRSDAKLDRYVSMFDRHGLTRWAVDRSDGSFLGYAGIMLVEGDHPLGVHHEIGWRLRRAAWGKGYATEAASAALHDAFTRVGLSEVLAYTSVDNVRSQAVMRRLELTRDPSRDFTAVYDDIGEWNGLVWVADPSRLTTPTSSGRRRP
ncbi:MAG: GNAT family N-acetyltransferase [Ilumatobacter sp.]|uniref:GNAT family N-acetyltransferase n=1 Tax=Ilumatobacter sp. TaxID=1967498 RepID=UPI002631BCBD|nr:GNAT family N-acetyltransferase [Ilumatobacter sp.]MDJ0767867.1 GNAT family N-acetyltransferase [Ilumatobacter sp.]